MQMQVCSCSQHLPLTPARPDARTHMLARMLAPTQVDAAARLQALLKAVAPPPFDPDPSGADAQQEAGAPRQRSRLLLVVGPACSGKTFLVCQTIDRLRSSLGPLAVPWSPSGIHQERDSHNDSICSEPSLAPRPAAASVDAPHPASEQVSVLARLSSSVCLSLCQSVFLSMYV